MQSIRRSLLCLSLATLVLPVALPSWAQAQEARGSKSEAKAMADAALAHIAKAGFDTAIKDFSTDKARWINKDLYVAVFNFEGQCLAHGVNEKLIGRQMLEIKDPGGRSFVKDFIASAQRNAEGWVDLEWAHPGTKKLEAKTMNTRRVPGRDAVLVVGYYL
jgi:cytochrome c